MNKSADSSPLASRPDAIPSIGGEPTHWDRFQHYGWAQALAAFVEDVLKPHADGGDAARDSRGAAGSFLILLEGPWGSGKSSLLEFLKQCLGKSQHRKPNVVEFNAWMHQRGGPIWFSLVEQIYLNAKGGKSRGPLLRWLSTFGLRRKLRLVSYPLVLFLAGIPLIGGTLFAAAVFVVLFWAVGAAESGSISAFFAALKRGIDFGMAQNAEATYSLIVAFGALAIWFSFRLRRFLSSAYSKSLAAAEFLGTKPNAIEQTKTHFREDLRRQSAEPIVVLVDDLDRCDPDIVVDCLNALQTLLRSTNVVYIVAANRKWLRDCFDVHFQQLPRAGQRSGATLGDLFLDKIFQLSVRVPGLSDEGSLNYLKHLLGRPDGPDGPQAGRTGNAAVPEDSTGANDNRKPGNKPEETASRQAEIDRAVSGFLLGNPRLINRFTNEIKFKLLLQERLDPQGAGLPSPCIWGWTLLRIRWPSLADCFYDHPELCQRLPALLSGVWSTRTEALDAFPEALHDVLISTEFQAFFEEPLFGLTDTRVFAECVRLG